VGVAVVERLLADGARVVFGGQGDAVADSARARYVGRAGRRAGAAAGLVAEAIRVLGGLDGLVVSCGEPSQARLSETSDRAWDAMLGSHVLEPWRLMSAAAAELRATRGAIVAIASAADEWPSALAGPHSVGAHALVSMTRMLAAELAPSEVRVNALCPDHEPSSEVPESVAGAVAFLLTTAAGACTAGSLVVDGGRRASLVAGAAVAT
jgi:NAD(P)-dependent dehydrogenase (short-subunit alcohol dehydrogenase family)